MIKNNLNEQKLLKSYVWNFQVKCMKMHETCNWIKKERV